MTSIEKTVKEFKELKKIFGKDIEEYPIIEKLYNIGTDENKLKDFLKVTGISLEEFNYMSTERFITALKTYETKQQKIKLPRMQRPKERIMSNDLFTNMLFNPDTMNTEETMISGHYNPTPKECKEYTISTEDSTALMDKRVYEYGRAVMDTVYTLYQNGVNVYTLSSLYKAIVQDNSSNKRVNNSQLKTLFECLKKLNTTWVDLDGVSGTLVDVLAKETSGKKLSMRSLNDENIDLNQIIIGFSRPPLLSANSGSQRITVPAELLRIQKIEDGKLLEKQEQSTPDRIAIKNYLIRNVNSIITGHLNNNTMSIDTILYKSLGEVTESRTEKQRHRQYIETVLKNFELKGMIKGFEEVKQGTEKNSKITGYKISF